MPQYSAKNEIKVCCLMLIFMHSHMPWTYVCMVDVFSLTAYAQNIRKKQKSIAHIILCSLTLTGYKFYHRSVSCPPPKTRHHT